MTKFTNSLHQLFSSSVFLIIVFQLVIGFTYPHAVYAAQPVPDKDSLVNQINQDVQDDMSKKPLPNQQSSSSSGDSGSTNSTGSGSATDVANTGDNASVDNSTNNSTDTTVNNTNNANVNQNVNATANTGYNEAKGNISFGGNAGVIQTGNAGVNVQGSVSANNNATGVNNGSGNGGSSTNVYNSGNGTSVSTSADNSTTTVVNNNNDATIHQGANARANTGGNDASGNIAIGGGYAGVILTGDAWTDISFMTVANGSATLVGGNGNGSGPGNGADIYITNTGGRFSGIGRLYQRTSTLVENSNNAVVNQSCGGRQGECSAITGGNESSNNIAFGADAGVIQTGDAVVNVVMEADVNSNSTAVHNGNGSNEASSNTNVVNTGDDASVSGSAVSQTDTTVNNKNNASVNQNVNAVADTGHNKANYNISFGGNAGVIQTGNAVVNVVMDANVNSNETQVSGASADMNNAPSGGNNTNVVNTGDNATIKTSSNSTTNTTIVNSNFLDLKQHVDAKSTTGNNNASDNIALGGGCLFSRFGCGYSGSTGGAAGVIITGNALINSFMGVVANQNYTNDPIGGGNAADPVDPADPADPQDPASQVQSSSNATNTNPTPTPHIVSFGAGGAGVISGTASQLLANGTVAKVGKILGAATSLPKTGSTETLILMTLAAAICAAGFSIRKFTYTHVNSRKEVKQ